MKARPIVARALDVKPSLKDCSITAKAFRMSEETHKNMSREERLAAKLRENLRRRKAQAREIGSESRESGLSKDEEPS